MDVVVGNLPANPSHIWIEPTSRCNTRCTYCAHYYRNFGEDMPRDVFERIAQRILPHVKCVELVGFGEPLLARDFNRMMDICASQRKSMIFITNGILLKDADLASRLVRSNVRIHFSIDGARPETCGFSRPFIPWDRMIESLEFIKRRADDAGKAKRFSLCLNFVAMKHNIGDLPDMVRLAAKYGAEKIYALPLGNETSCPKVDGQSLTHEPQLVSPAFLQALRLSLRLGVQLAVPPVFCDMLLDKSELGGGLRGFIVRLGRKSLLAWAFLRWHGLGAAVARACRNFSWKKKVWRLRCPFPWHDANFAADGSVFACCIMGEKLGSIASQTWEEIWNGPLYWNLRRTIHSWNPTSICRSCPVGSGINGGDQEWYGKYFSKYRIETVSLDSPEAEFTKGFYELERTIQGDVSHCWMGRQGTLCLPYKKDTRFLRLNVIPRSHLFPQTNPGRGRINGGPWEPFDNTCPEITFPVNHIGKERLRVELEMENAWKAPGDPRELGLAISGIKFLA